MGGGGGRRGEVIDDLSGEDRSKTTVNLTNVETISKGKNVFKRRGAGHVGFFELLDTTMI